MEDHRLYVKFHIFTFRLLCYLGSEMRRSKNVLPALQSTLYKTDAFGTVLQRCPLRESRLYLIIIIYLFYSSACNI